MRKWIMGLCLLAASAAQAADYRDRLPEDEVIYFVLPDRFANGDAGNDAGGLHGGRLITGFDPTHKGFFHGGDLKGLLHKLDYIQSLGATAIWLTPVFKNKAVQGPKGDESAGYHGYWVTDFTTVDPHLGTEADFKALVDAAHGRGMKVYMDIIANHTADVIKYRDCPKNDCAYRSRADYPYQRRVADGAAINAGFAGDQVQTVDNMARLTDMGFAYSPYIPKGEEQAKKPAWLNDVRYYHNRGDTTYWNESATMGDFSGLDDVMTENPRVVQGFIDIYGAWIDRFGVDGFRVDTARHVNPEFWQAFIPAMLERAKAKGIPHFHIFGEIGGIGLEPGRLAKHTRVDGFPAVLDFAFRQAVLDVVSGTGGTDHLWQLFEGDSLYQGGIAGAMQQPTFISNHDNGRIGYFIKQAIPAISDEELFQRVRLAQAMLLTLRGVPTIYYGDEQGFVGDGGDQAAREDMFPTKTASYADNQLIGTNHGGAGDHFDMAHPLYQMMATLSHLRTQNPLWLHGTQIIRRYGEKSGIFAVSRVDRKTGQELVLVFNSAVVALSANIEVEPASSRFISLYGDCPTMARSPATVAVTLKPFDFMICKAEPQ